MDGDTWTSGGRAKRRLGTLHTPDAPPRWVGFAGLARTVTERLIQEGATRDEDRAALSPRSHTLATVRHVLGGECTASNVQPLLSAVLQIETFIRREGGTGSALHETVAAARAQL